MAGGAGRQRVTAAAAVAVDSHLQEGTVGQQCDSSPWFPSSSSGLLLHRLHCVPLCNAFGAHRAPNRPQRAPTGV